MPKTYVETMLGDNEKVLLLERQHWFRLVNAVIEEVVIVLIILIAITLVLPLFPLASLLYVLVLIPLGKGIYDFLGWLNREFVITNRRVIQISGILNKSVTDSSLEKVTDLKLEQSALGRMFNYGDIEILTASELGANRFRQIADPIRFKTTMLDAKETMSGDEDLPRSGRTRGEVASKLEELDELRKKGILTEQEFQEKKAKLMAKL
ncbi:MAG: PH domain-containing protein [Anaerolineales bacterium]